MGELEALPLKNNQGEPLVHKFYTQGKQAKGLAVFFPGSHYGVDGPALYYPRELMDHAGWDTLAITYGYQSRAEPFTTEQIPGILRECAAGMRDFLSERQYARIVMIGKSLGCGVVAFLAQTEEDLKEALTIYLTPPLGTPAFDPMFAMTHQPALVALGSDDRFYNPEAIQALQDKRDFDLVLIEGVDHSFDKPGDMATSLRAVETVTEKIFDFVTNL
jgi:dienelactone hydrolase